MMNMLRGRSCSIQKERVHGLASGAFNVVGSNVGELIANTPLGQNRIVGDSIVRFSSVLVSGLLSCSLLVLLDRSKTINSMYRELNQYLTTERELKLIAERCCEISAELNRFDLNEFKALCECYSSIAYDISNTENEEELKSVLNRIYSNYDIKKPYTGDFDDFMNDKSRPWEF